MQSRDSVFDWAIPCGTWFGVRVRLSALLLLAAAILCVQKWNVHQGLVFGFCLLAAVFVHELAHAVALRLTRTHVGEMLLWPLGGPARSLGPGRSVAPAVALAGPAANLAACLLLLLAVEPTSWAVLHPFRLPAADFEKAFGGGLAAYAFFANWIVLLANLIPAAPLDAGAFAEQALVSRLGHGLGQQTFFRLGMAAGFAVIIAALLFQSVWLGAFGAAIAVYNLRESHRLQLAESYDESFMGYDFSQGYTSLERSVPAEADLKPGAIRRWIAHRKVLREERQRQREEQAERELDALLEKVHTVGIEGLTDAERRTLKRAADRYRGRSKS